MSELGGSTVGPHLEFLNGVQGRDHCPLIIVDLSYSRLFASDSIHRVADSALALPNGVRSIDIVHVRHIEQYPMNELLHHGQALNGTAFKNLTNTGVLGLEQRGLTRDIH